MQDRQHCPLCEKHGIVSYLNSFQINLVEAVLLCENSKCLYPVGLTSSNDDCTFKRNFSSLGGCKDDALRVPSAQQALQSQLAPLMCRQNVHKAVSGTQTGSPLYSSIKDTTTSSARQPEINQRNCLNGFRVVDRKVLKNGYHSVAVGLHEVSKLPAEVMAPSQLQSGLKSGQSGLSLAVNRTKTNSINLKRSTPEFPAFQFGQKVGQDVSDTRSYLMDGSKVVLDDTFENVSENCEEVDKDLNALFELVSTAEDPTHVTISDTRIGNSNLGNNVMSDSDVLVPGESKDAAEKSSQLVDGLSCHKEPMAQLFPQWLNKDALCWLDVVLCLLVHNFTVRKLVLGEKSDKNCILYKLLKAHDQAKSILNKLQKKSSLEKHTVAENSVNCMANNSRVLEESETQEHDNRVIDDKEEVDVENTGATTAGGLDAVAKDMLTMHGILDEVREEVWSRLKTRLRCEKGQKDSPVFAMPLLLQQNPHIEKLFRMSYSFRFFCGQCEQEEVNEYENTVPTFPSVVEDFTMDEPKHTRQCFRCGNKNGSRTMIYKRLPKCLVMHFVEGIPCTSWSRLQFGFHGNLYTVTGVVQFVNKPDHFIAWLRNPKTNHWVKCDDLGTLVCEFEDKLPDIPADQVHVVMWERQAIQKTATGWTATSGNPRVPVKKSVINSVGGSSNQQLAVNRFHVSDQERCVVCGRLVSSLRNQKCERCSKLPISASFQTSSIISPVSYSGNSDTLLCSKSNTSVSNVIPVAGIQGAFLEPLVSMGTIKQDIADSSRSSTPCSSLSSLSETSAESLTLPKFTICTQESSRLVKPVPCKMDVLALKSTGTSSKLRLARVGSSDNSVGNNGALNRSAGKLNHTVSILRFLKGNKGRSNMSDAKTESSTLKVEHNGLYQGGSTAKPSSAFCAAPKSKVKTSRNTNSIAPSKTTSKCLVKDTAYSEKSMGSLSKSESTPSLISKFKLPSYLRKPASSGNLSKEAFRTLSRPTKSNSKESSPFSSNSPSPAGSPALNGYNSYLSTVKQYLINRTTGTAESKSKFEGLNLKTAPELKRSTNLTGLHFSTPVASPLPPEPGKCATPSAMSKLASLINSKVQNNKGVKRASVENITAVKPKVVRKGSTETGTTTTAIGSEKSSKTNVRSDCHRNSVKSACVRKRGGKNMSIIKQLNGENEKQFTSSSSFKVLQKNKSMSLRQINGVSPQNFSNDSQLEEPRCDTDSVLQDLYEALNIPFKAVPDTMSDIMMDVNDILGMVDTCNLVPEPAFTPTGNQASLDCSMSLMFRNMPSNSQRGVAETRQQLYVDNRESQICHGGVETHPQHFMEVLMGY